MTELKPIQTLSPIVTGREATRSNDERRAAINPRPLPDCTRVLHGRMKGGKRAGCVDVGIVSNNDVFGNGTAVPVVLYLARAYDLDDDFGEG